jgi:hypothetical protein
MTAIENFAHAFETLSDDSAKFPNHVRDNRSIADPAVASLPTASGSSINFAVFSRTTVSPRQWT